MLREAIKLGESEARIQSKKAETPRSGVGFWEGQGALGTRYGFWGAL